MAFRNILQVDKLKGKSGDVPVASLEGKYLMLYFSASWCPPCRQFTPVLAKFYGHLAGRAEIVFVSSDKEEGSFNDYYGHHPWLALPFQCREQKAALSKLFKVSGIPCLVLLDPSGKVLTKDGTSWVGNDKEAKAFPWPELSQSVIDILGKGPILTHDGQKALTVEDLKQPGSYFGIYFSAHWCPPCRQFTPHLAQVYKKAVAAGKPLNIIFASSDKTERDFQTYFREMPWAALPHGDRRIQLLNMILDFEGIPTLIMFDHTGTMVNDKGRREVSKDTDGSKFPWLPQATALMKLVPEEEVMEAVNEKICVILVAISMPPPKVYCGRQYGEPGECECGRCNGQCGPTNGCACPDCQKKHAALPVAAMSGDVEGATAAFTAAANANTNKNMQYLVAADTGILNTLGQFLKLDMGVSKPTVFAVHVQSKKSQKMGEEISTATVGAFAQAFASRIA